MNTAAKGNTLEDAFYDYLVNQRDQGGTVFDLYPASACKIFKKKRYPDPQRGSDVEFDVVIEVTKPGRPAPHLYVVFECKNYDGAIPETVVNDFSVKLDRLFPHASKGILVISSRLQSGAENVARYQNMGIVKYDGSGFETVADRKAAIPEGFLQSQLFRGAKPAKSLRFSAYFDGRFYGSVGALLGSIDPDAPQYNEAGSEAPKSVPYISVDTIKIATKSALETIEYTDGAVDLEEICRRLSLNVDTSHDEILDSDGVPILGSAYFDRNLIRIFANGNPHRERFTLAHEIGHFHLNHGALLRSETLIQSDLLVASDSAEDFNFDRLEYQANVFASNLLLPDDHFIAKTAIFRKQLDITDRGHGYIYVDNQPANQAAYLQLLGSLSLYFRVSKKAVEIKLKTLKMLTDERQFSALPFGGFLSKPIELR